MPDDTITVEITYSPQRYDVGTIRTLPADEARLLIREGRARRHYGPAEGSTAGAVPRTTAVPARQSSPDAQARRSQTPASTSRPAATGTRRPPATPPAT